MRNETLGNHRHECRDHATQGVRSSWRPVSWLYTEGIPTGMRIHVMTVRIVLMPVRSTEFTRVKRLVSSSSLAA